MLGHVILYVVSSLCFVSVHYSSKDKKINIKYILNTANTL